MMSACSFAVRRVAAAAPRCVSGKTVAPAVANGILGSAWTASPGAMPAAAVGGVGAGIGPVRTVMTKMQRKRIRKRRAREIRALVKYAEKYDPMRRCVRSVYQTLQRMGWSFEQKHLITEGCYTMFALADQMIAIEIVSPEEYAEPPAYGVSPISMAKVLTPEEVRAASETTFIPHTSTGFVHESLVNPPALNEETQAKHDLIQAKGWDLIVIYQPEWATCLEHRKQHVARHDYIVQRALRVRTGLEPAEPESGDESEGSDFDSDEDWGEYETEDEDGTDADSDSEEAKQ